MMEKLFDLTGKKIVVTGASSGIGEGVANMLGYFGAQCILVARREEKLEKVANAISGGEILNGIMHLIWNRSDGSTN